MKNLLLLLVAALMLSACVKRVNFKPPRYEPASAEGNQCRNACLSNFYQCYNTFADVKGGLEMCSSQFKSGLHLGHCFELCERFYGGNYSPYEKTLEGPGVGDECVEDVDCNGSKRCISGYCKTPRRR